MSIEKETLFKELAEAVVNMEEEQAVGLAWEAIALGIDAYETIEKGLIAGMTRAGELFEEEEYFIPELLMCSDAMYAGLEILKPHIKTDALAERPKIVIGVVEGDTHDIGKNLVKIMLESSGFELHDLGRDIVPTAFVDKAVEVNAQIIALSTLMTTTMDAMGEVVKILDQRGLHDRIKVMIGGGPISQQFADKIGADGYSAHAAGAVRLAKRLTGLEA